MARLERLEMVPIMLLLAGLAGFGVANTVMFTVLERTREFGVLMAVGLKPRRLARMVLAESVLASGLGFIFGGGAGYGLIIYLSLSVLERIRELGVIRALGASARRTMGLVLAESLVLAVCGALLGTGLGVGLVLWGSRGFTLPLAYEEMMATIGIEPVFYLRMTLLEGLGSALAMAAIAALAAWQPARKAGRLDPVKAMRYV